MTDKQPGFGVTALPYVGEAGQRPGPPQAKRECQGENKKNQQSKRRKDQIVLKLIDESKSPVFKITCSPSPSTLFPADFPKKQKDHSEVLARLPAPLCFPRAPSKGVTVTGMLRGRGAPGSTVCSAALWHLELFHPPSGVWSLHRDVPVPGV